MASNLAAYHQEYLYMRNFDMSIYFHIPQPTLYPVRNRDPHISLFCLPPLHSQNATQILGNGITDVFLQLLEEAHDDGKMFDTGFKPETWVRFSSWCSGGIPGCDAFSGWKNLIQARICRYTSLR